MMPFAPSSPCAAGSGLVRGRELTASEEREFLRRRARARLALCSVVLALPVMVAAIVWGATRPEVHKRVRVYPNGTPHIEAEYMGPVKNGRYTEYHQNGQRKAEGAYVDGIENGRWTTWYWNGVKASEGSHRHGLYHGTWRYFRSDGALERELYFDRGHARDVWHASYEADVVEERAPRSVTSPEGRVAALR